MMMMIILTAIEAYQMMFGVPTRKSRHYHDYNSTTVIIYNIPLPHNNRQRWRHNYISAALHGFKLGESMTSCEYAVIFFFKAKLEINIIIIDI